MATIGRSREAIRTGIFHLCLMYLVLLLALANQLADLTQWISGENVARQIANAHVLFNVAGVLLFVWFTPQFAKLLKSIFLIVLTVKRCLIKKVTWLQFNV